jgi:hypothetical protein
MNSRLRAVAYKDEGHTFKELKQTFGIPVETFYQWKEKIGSGYYETKTIREYMKGSSLSIFNGFLLHQLRFRLTFIILFRSPPKFSCGPNAMNVSVASFISDSWLGWSFL